MLERPELLSPAGDLERLKYAVMFAVVPPLRVCRGKIG